MSGKENTETIIKARAINQEIKDEAENRIMHKFPERIIYLNELLKKSEFQFNKNEMNYKFGLEVPKRWKMDKYDCNEENSDKVPSSDANPDDTDQMIIPSNKVLIEALEIIKPNINQLIEDTTALTIWLNLLIPKKEDGNNFGVSVQKQTLGDISSIQRIAISNLKLASVYCGARAKLITKVLKWPFIEDFRRSVEILDQKQALLNSLVMHEMRNDYSSLYDTVIKNMEKIKKPKPSNTDSLIC